MTTIAQQLKIKEFPFQIKDSNGNRIYCERSEGYWYKKEFNSNGKETYYEDSNGFWSKAEYDSNGNLIYCEDSKGVLYDKRSVELTMDEIAKKFGIDVNLLKIKK